MSDTVDHERSLKYMWGMFDDYSASNNKDIWILKLIAEYMYYDTRGELQIEELIIRKSK